MEYWKTTFHHAVKGMWLDVAAWVHLMVMVLSGKK